MSARALAAWVGFQAVWLAAAFGAAHGSSLPGVAAGLIFVAAVAAGSDRPAREITLAVATAACGLVVESALALAGIVQFSAAGPLATLAPPWLISLWAAFAGTLASLDRLVGALGTPAVAAIGAVTGPLAYLAGARIGALTISEPVVPGLLVLALVWGLVLPLLLRLRARC